jgi:hypothetical protein
MDEILLWFQERNKLWTKNAIPRSKQIRVTCIFLFVVGVFS